MVPPPRTGTFSPAPAPALQTGISHTSHPPQTGASAGPSPSVSTPSGTRDLITVVVTQVYFLLSAIKEDKDDPLKWDSHTQQLRKLIDDHGMEVFTRFFSRLVAGNASQIFPGLSRPVGNTGNHHLLVAEMHKISHDASQARNIAESIETGTEDIFRDFDLSSFMEHFKLDALEKTILALAFKLGPRMDLKTKADAILSTNFPTFVNILSRPEGEHEDLSPAFIALIVDRYIQHHPPNFTPAAKQELHHKVLRRYSHEDMGTPSEVLAALDLMRLGGERPPNALVLYMQKTGVEFTRDEEACVSCLQVRPNNISPSEEQVANALMYATLSQTPRHNPDIFVAGLRRVLPNSFRWQDVIPYFDVSGARISAQQFLRLYSALRPIAVEEPDNFDIQHLWGGSWEYPETQLSFICAFTSLNPDQMDATTIPRIEQTFALDEYSEAAAPIRERAAEAVKHPLSSRHAIIAIFNVALHSTHASTNVEAKRLFQGVVVPNLDIFVVSSFGVPKPWSLMAIDTLTSLFDGFLSKRDAHYDFVLDSLWRRDKLWVIQRLSDAHAVAPSELPLIYEHAVNHGWLDELVYLPRGFALDLAAFWHAQGGLDLDEWAKNCNQRGIDMGRPLLDFVKIKAELEQRSQRPATTPSGAPPAKGFSLPIRTISALLTIVEEYFASSVRPEDLVAALRSCITTYPRLINYGEGFDGLIEENGRNGHLLPQAANTKMEEYFKKMYGDEIEVRQVVEALRHYKHSPEPLDQDIFVCMIHSLFDEYSHFGDYPLEALATTAVLFGGIIRHKLISGIPLQIGLGMILEAVRDQATNHPMYKFGLQALMQLFPRLREWPAFCASLLRIPGLRGTDARQKAEEAVRGNEEEMGLRGGPVSGAPGPVGAEVMANGSLDDPMNAEQQPAPFVSVNPGSAPGGVAYEDPDDDTQGKIQFCLNNLDGESLPGRFKELRPMLEERHQQWFAKDIVEARAKRMPNYHIVYLTLVSLFQDRSLWAEVLRQTFVSVSLMLNSEGTMQSSSERTFLKNLGAWLGLMTLARDKPIKEKNIAFKQLLIEGHDTKRLIVVIPFVCKVLLQGQESAAFRPPNPWLMGIIRVLIELYHNAELKLNLKFEIEVLCQELKLDHKSIIPSSEIVNRAPVEEIAELIPETLESFETLSLNGIGAGVASSLSPHAMAPAIPELGPSITLPQVSDMIVSSTRLHEIVRNALTRALQDIIQPVVDRSVAIAAIATQQMIHKDFATEMDENRIRNSAISMVKATAGSLAQVTSKEPLRANFTNYMRSLSNDLPQGTLPEGTIILCVNSNLDLASSIIEKSTEERAVPEIEELLEGELDIRRRHRAQRPNEAYVDPALSRWAMTIPPPFKLHPSQNGLNPEQMAIYEDFARPPRASAGPSAPSHVASTSDATRSLANEILQDQYSSVPSVPTPAETPSVASAGPQVAPYPHMHGPGMVNGRPPNSGPDMQKLLENVMKLIGELQRTALEAPDLHFTDLPRPHAVLDVIDALVQNIIKGQQASTEFALHAAGNLCDRILFASPTRETESSLALESAVHVLETIQKIAGPSFHHQLVQLFRDQPAVKFLRIPLITVLLGTDLIDWDIIDRGVAAQLNQRNEESIGFLQSVMELTLLNDNPITLYSDFIRSLDAAWTWISEDPEVPGGQEFRVKVLAPIAEAQAARPPDGVAHARRDEMEYIFDEWVQLFMVSDAPERARVAFVEQMQHQSSLATKEDLFTFLRLSLDKSVERFEQSLQHGGSIGECYASIDALANLVACFVKLCAEDDAGSSPRAVLLDSVLSLAVVVVNHHYVKRGEHFNQKVFHRFFSMLLHEISAISEQLTDADRNEILLKFAARFNDMGPATFPGFVYAWLSLIEHRIFLPSLLQMASNTGWAPFTKIMKQLFEFVGEQLKAVEVTHFGKEIYRATLKLLVVLNHDFPEFLTTNHVPLCQSIPAFCTQFVNMVLIASPPSNPKIPDPTLPGLRVDRMEEAREIPSSAQNPAGLLERIGLLGILEQALQSGPSEDAIAHITHTINKSGGKRTTFANIPLGIRLPVIDAVVSYIGSHAAGRVQSGGLAFISGASDVAILNMVAHELSPEGRYYFLTSMVNQLRFANVHTNFFSQAILDIFGHDMGDPEEMDIREQICRILFERMIGYWPQPWGLMVTMIELVKNDKYMLFEQPFLKAAPDVSERFAAIVTR